METKIIPKKLLKFTSYFYCGGEEGPQEEYFKEFQQKYNLIKPIHSYHCVCGSKIKHNLYITNKEEVLIVGTTCASHFTNFYKTCSMCSIKHKNYDSNKCTKCKKKYAKSNGKTYENRNYDKDSSYYREKYSGYCIDCNKKCSYNFEKCFNCNNKKGICYICKKECNKNFNKCYKCNKQNKTNKCQICDTLINKNFKFCYKHHLNH